MVKHIIRLITYSFFVLCPIMSYGMQRIARLPRRFPSQQTTTKLPPIQPAPITPGPIPSVQPVRPPVAGIPQPAAPPLSTPSVTPPTAPTYIQEQKRQEQEALHILSKSQHLGNDIIKALMNNESPQAITQVIRNTMQIAKEQGYRVGFVHHTADTTINYLIKTLAEGNRTRLKWKRIGKKEKPVLQFTILPDGSIVFLEASLQDFSPLLIKPTLSPLHSLGTSLLDRIPEESITRIEDVKGVTELKNRLIEANKRITTELQQKTAETIEATKAEKEKIPYYTELIDQAIELGLDQVEQKRYKDLLNQIIESTASPQELVARRNEIFAELENIVSDARAAKEVQVKIEKELTETQPQQPTEKSIVTETAETQANAKKRKELEHEFNDLLEEMEASGFYDPEYLQQLRSKTAELNLDALEDRTITLKEDLLDKEEAADLEADLEEALRKEVDLDYEKFEKELEEIQRTESEVNELTREIKSAQQEIENIQQQKTAAQLEFDKQKAKIETESAAALDAIEPQTAQTLAQAKQSIENQKNIRLKEIEDTAATELKKLEDQLAEITQQQTERKASHELAKQQTDTKLAQAEADLKDQEERNELYFQNRVTTIQQQKAAAQLEFDQQKTKIETDAAAALDAIEPQTAQTLAQTRQSIEDQKNIRLKEIEDTAAIELKKLEDQLAEITNKHNESKAALESSKQRVEQARLDAEQAAKQEAEMQAHQAAEKLKNTEKLLLEAREKAAQAKAEAELAAKKTTETKDTLEKAQKDTNLAKQTLEILQQQQAEIEKQHKELREQLTIQEKEKADLQAAEEKAAQEIELAKRQEILAEKTAAEQAAQQATEKAQEEQLAAEKTVAETIIEQNQLTATQKQAATDLTKQQKVLNEIIEKTQVQEKLEREKLEEQIKKETTIRTTDSPGGDGQIDSSEDTLPSTPSIPIIPTTDDTLPTQPIDVPKIPTVPFKDERSVESTEIPSPPKEATSPQAKPSEVSPTEQPSIEKIKQQEPHITRDELTGVHTPTQPFDYRSTMERITTPTPQKKPAFVPHIPHGIYTPSTTPTPSHNGYVQSRYSRPTYVPETHVIYQPKEKVLPPPPIKTPKRDPQDKELIEKLPETAQTGLKPRGQYLRSILQQLKQKADMRRKTSIEKESQEIQKEEKPVHPAWEFIKNIPTTIKNFVTGIIDYVGQLFTQT